MPRILPFRCVVSRETLRECTSAVLSHWQRCTAREEAPSDHSSRSGWAYSSSIVRSRARSRSVRRPRVGRGGRRRRAADTSRKAARGGREGVAPDGASAQVERLDLEERRLRAEIEEFLADASRSGGVVLGRGGAVVLASVPGALHVYLGGTGSARIERVMELERRRPRDRRAPRGGARPRAAGLRPRALRRRRRQPEPLPPDDRRRLARRRRLRRR